MYNPLRRRYRDHEIAPDEIFLDASNLPAFDQSRLEGRLEKPIPHRTYRMLAGSLVLMLCVLIGQAWHLQITQGAEYAEKSERNVLRPSTIFAERGAITDRNGIVLVSNEKTEHGFNRRLYPEAGFSSLLGYVSYPKKDSAGNYYDTEIKGLAGVEKSFDDILSGTNGSLLIEEDSKGNIISQGSRVAARHGENLTLSIDAHAQKAFYDAVRETAEKAGFQSGAGVLMDVNTGEVVALVSYPEFSSNVLSSGGPKEVIQRYQTDPRQVYLNRPVQGLYTPGSIVKPLIAAGALTDGIITPDVTVEGKGYISIPNPYDPSKPNIFKDWKVHGVQDLREAIAWSSDTYFYTIGGGYQGQKGLGIERLNDWYRTFGFTSGTGIDLPGEETGFVPTPEWKLKRFGEAWNIGNTYHTSIGQYSMQITPIEAARAIAAVANGGKLITPTVRTGQRPVGESIAVDASALHVAREGMRLAVTEGTALGLNDLSSFVTIAAKTGTAQLGYRNEFYNAWAVGFFPYDTPTYVFVVVMEKGKAGGSTGGIYVMHQFFTKLHAAAPEFFEQ